MYRIILGWADIIHFWEGSQIVAGGPKKAPQWGLSFIGVIFCYSQSAQLDFFARAEYGVTSLAGQLPVELVLAYGVKTNEASKSQDGLHGVRSDAWMRVNHALNLWQQPAWSSSRRIAHCSSECPAAGLASRPTRNTKNQPPARVTVPNPKATIWGGVPSPPARLPECRSECHMP